MAWQYPHVARHAVMPGQQTPVKQCAGVMAVNAIAEIVEVRILPIICSCILLFGLLGIVVMASLSPLALVLSRIPKLCSLTNLRLAALGSFRL